MSQSKITEANKIIDKYLLYSLGLYLIPLPFINTIGIAGVNVKMVHSLAKLYNVPFSVVIVKSVIASLISMGISSALNEPLKNLIKHIPVIGRVSSLSSSLIISGASIYAIGKVFILHFESGGTILTFKPENVRTYYAGQFEIGGKRVTEKKNMVTSENN